MRCDPAAYLDTLGFDWDGVISASPGYTPAGDGETDLTPIREALARGYSVAVITCNIPAAIAAYLTRNGIRAFADLRMRHDHWEDTSGVVLVTNRKVHVRLMADDRGFEYHYGQDPELIFAEAGKRLAERRAARKAGRP